MYLNFKVQLILMLIEPAVMWFEINYYNMVSSFFFLVIWLTVWENGIKNLKASFSLPLLFDIANIFIELHRSDGVDTEWIPIETILDK